MAWSNLTLDELDWLNGRGIDDSQPGLHSSQALDPYLLWACATQFRGFANQPEFARASPGETLVSILAKVTVDGDVQQLSKRCAWLTIPKVYTKPVPGSDSPVSRFFTARVALHDLWRLRHCGDIESWELGLPVISLDGTPPVGTAVTGGHAAAPQAAAVERSLEPVEKVGQANGVIAVIDDGCAFMNRAFRNAAGTQTRVRRLWDQGQPAKASHHDWHQPTQFGYGRALAGEKIDPSVVAREDELAVYRTLGYLRSDDSDATSSILARTHGTHVLDVAAGVDDPLNGRRDTASGADIVFVHLPRLTAIDSSGGSLAVHVLDAIRYILDASAPDAGIVVNLSYGTLAGPHDGSTLLEQAMDDLLEKRKNNFAIVIGAGNDRQLPAHIGGRLTVETPAVLMWNVPATDTTDSFLEIWYDLPKDGGVTVQATPPRQQHASEPVALGVRRRLDLADGPCIAAILHEPRVANGGGPMVLIAQAATQAADGDADDGSHATPGVWTITLRTTSGQPVPFHAWIERDAAPSRSPEARQSTFDDVVVDGNYTLNSLATGEHTIVVGGCRLSDGEEASYSSRGPVRGGKDRRNRPDVLAACNQNEALFG
ncbi:MAG TPA: S8 family serine peptidase, partial [Albitalea sp.]|nr:S8 family serine peptidase [Albitalea sp.]